MMCILISISVDKILLPRYVNWYMSFRYLPLKVEMIPSCLERTDTVLFAFTTKPILLAVFFRLRRMDSTRPGVFVRNARLSA